ncbi:hypothetical protein [Bradyrhizobium retamae]|uniref:HTH merR-type domain-containing protein n=1 Tax=Bradyrhizobium retamae TaxID=1300035 RepID=A0A0R3MW41_9BRAD|nr:hypothetical protein [Bradyrhizobium retamae]KRR21872.1 hypothetical protein CQ13_07500 [Bradyrhizobium retamae]
MTKRGLSKQEAADYCGCATLAAFDRWRRQGIVDVNPIPGTNIYDRKALDLALDAASGIVTRSPAEELSPYQRWKADNASKTEAA